MKRHLKNADRLSAIVRHVDAKVLAALPEPSRPSPHQKDLRSALAAMSQPAVGQSEILAAIRKTRSEIKAAFQKADRELDAAEAELADLKALKSYLDGQVGDLPDSLPSDIRACAISIRASKAANVATSPSLGGNLSEVIATGEAAILRHRGVVQRRKAASDVGVSKHLSAKLKGFSTHPSLSKGEQAIMARAANRFSIQEVKAMARSKAAQSAYNRAVRLGA